METMTSVAASLEPAREPSAGTRQALAILRIAYVAAPLAAGLDKFFNVLVDWDKYLAPKLFRSPRKRRRFMRAVGVVEIAAGALVAARPRLGGYVVAGWLGGIIGNLLLGRRDYDVALRDLGLALGALAMAQLGADRQRATPPAETPVLH
jgi:hypothetical protein